VLAYAVVAVVALKVPEAEFPAWHTTAGAGTAVFSAAGWWHALVSVPLLLVLFLGLMWRLILWSRFLWRMAQLDLHLLPAHPDRAAGLKFVGYSLRAWSPLAFALGTIVAGAVANGVLHQNAALLDYRYLIAGLAALMVALFIVPLLMFTRQLLEASWRGVFEYGALADGFTREFERKWVGRSEPLDESMLESPDFSAASDLNQIADRIYDMHLVPVSLKTVAWLVVPTLLPFVPVVVIALPLDRIFSGIAGLLF
jgi:hypothetical protein